MALMVKLIVIDTHKMRTFFQQVIHDEKHIDLRSRMIVPPKLLVSIVKNQQLFCFRKLKKAVNGIGCNKKLQLS